MCILAPLSCPRSWMSVVNFFCVHVTYTSWVPAETFFTIFSQFRNRPYKARFSSFHEKSRITNCKIGHHPRLRYARDNHPVLGITSASFNGFSHDWICSIFRFQTDTFSTVQQEFSFTRVLYWRYKIIWCFTRHLDLHQASMASSSQIWNFTEDVFLLSRTSSVRCAHGIISRDLKTSIFSLFWNMLLS